MPKVCCVVQYISTGPYRAWASLFPVLELQGAPMVSNVSSRCNEVRVGRSRRGGGASCSLPQNVNKQPLRNLEKVA